jgi:type III restriction enzyme
MPRRAKSPQSQLSLLEPRVRTAPCVPAIKEAVDAWRASGYKSATETTRLLLNYWFKTDHRLPNNRPFYFFDTQRFAIETLIYLYEVAGVRRHKDLVEKYAGSNKDLRLLQYDDFARYCVKMATGSGKTKVMALAIAWQFFNAVNEPRDDYAKTFLLIAPNVIVFERLKKDFANGKIFRTDPIIPPELKIFWDFDCYMRGDPERASSQGALYLTNIQQFYERAENNNGDEPEAVTAVLGNKPPAQNIQVEDFDKRIAARGAPVMVINDEAHHTHDEESEWNRTIRRMHGGQDGKAGLLNAQLDFTATPRYSKGALFTWTVYDYPLKQAIIDGIVKRPMKGIASGIQEAKSSVASTRYKAYLTAGVERWREYCEQLAPLKKKPILFVMMNDTTEADDVGDYLQRKYPSDFEGDKLLVIHTDRSGEVSKKDLDKARQVAREVDRTDNPVNAIVSVLMLREGWDVENVTVVVGLRPYTAKANILPEQTIGRGLRMMFRDLATDYVERVDVIGNKAFIGFVEQLEKEEDIAFGTFDVGKDKLVIVTIQPDPDKMDKDIALPTLSPILSRKKTLAEEIAALDVASMKCPTLPRMSGDATEQTFRYEGYDLLTLQKLIERDYKLPEVQTAQEVISYYAKRIAQDVKLPAQFAALAPKVHEFLQTRAFGERVNLDDPVIIKAIATNVAQYVTVKTFVEALRPLVVQELTPQLLSQGRKLSETPPFPYSRPTIKAKKTVFNLVPCGNKFEQAFAEFLNGAPDITAFAKLPEQFGFAIEYTDASNNLRYYEPDFVAVAESKTHYLVETKGREDVDVANKDRAATLWAENATRLTGTQWQYVKVPQKEFEKLEPSEFADMLVFVPAPPM